MWLQCYVQQLRQIRQDAQQVGEAPSLGEPHKSGGADWSLLSPRGSLSQVTPSLITRAHSAHNPPVMASTEVKIWSPWNCSCLMYSHVRVRANMVGHFTTSKHVAICTDRCVSHTSTGLPDLPLGRHVWPYQTFSLI